MDNLFARFFNAFNNQSVEAEDITALNQCFDLAFKWCDYLNIPREAIRHEYAHQIWDQATDITRQYFDLIPNFASFVPNIGDIAVFKIAPGIPVGHVSIVAPGSDKNNLISLDQNWDTKHYFHLDDSGNHIAYCRIVNHAVYYGAIGFLRPKVVQSAQVTIMPPYLTQLFNEAGLDPQNEGAVRAFWQAAINYPAVKTDLDNAHIQIAGLSKVADNQATTIINLTSVNNQQADLLADLRKKLSTAQNTPDTNHNTSKPTVSFWDKFLSFLGLERSI